MNHLSAITISIGDELLSGKTLDSNNAFISKQLDMIGIPVIKKIIIGDIAQDIKDSLDWAFAQADVVTLTGGLGPTHDDITKSVLCDYFEVGLKLYPDLLEALKDRFQRRGFKFSESNASQAEYPENAAVLENPYGTAQGMHFKHNGKHLFVMAGVPREMEVVTTGQIIPILSQLTQKSISKLDIHSIGVPESTLYELSKPVLDEYSDLKIAYLPKQGMVTIRVSFPAKSLDDDQQLEDEIYGRVRDLKPKNIYGRDEDVLPVLIGKLLKQNRATVATAESCTGGLVASLITDISGSSDYFKTGFVTYANETKMSMLGVQEQTLIDHGAVSEETVSEMLSGTVSKSGADYAVAISGVAGPTGGTEEKPVGTVYIGVADIKHQNIKRFQFGKNRILNKEMSAFSALNLLRLLIEDTNQ
ncbi:MAG: competence/damage-inducible protein A [Candidatus Marinimicrobia bacterium]|jgi:nicotinamide-nucleotide amidase|nr:competence/damage-inducible protein A [Candidatus Neomarinimicrobiota bacterium]MBT4362172.1 competence/damage-inducible protein A [Candidatus Neomarinimicrobiota bacterium]MBT4716232.1 competence/damage-inducible protein A [Candidatus Neomarinimicrobiota bacterium]MBT4944642.1 competence/damage-inducible protein A [Candidatus Neomarinimicrobiota bacterium]MBT5270164.1 competence/damage-inducible protein A [Candidatus Neomarinimicrobiota bacterium]